MGGIILGKRLIRLMLVSIIWVFLIMKSIRSEQSNIKGSPTYGKITATTVVYNKIMGAEIDVIEKNTAVEILKDKSEKWYYIGYSAKRGWIKKEYLHIPDDPQPNNCQLGDEEIEAFSDKYLKSDTNYCIWVDIDRQRVYVLKNINGWHLEKRIICSTGRNKTPTTRGFYKIGDRGTWFYSQRLNSGAKYWVRFNDSYLFHSVAMDKEGKITDGVLGQRRSSGCVRMSVESAKWFYDNIPVGTTVFIY